MAKNCPLGKNVVQIGAKLPEMHNTSRELHNAFVDVVKGKFVEKRIYGIRCVERCVYLLHNIITKNCRAKWRILHLQNGENCRGYSDHQAMKN
ncbi:hypothetical protein ACTQVS_09575, partial [Anaerovoracaceae bacterium HCP3S3_H6]